MSFFYRIDLFRHPIQLRFNSESKRSSHIGLILSLGIYIFCLYSFFKSNMYLKESPFVISQTLTGTTTNPIQFNNNTELSFQISDIYGKFYYDPSIFIVIIRKFHQKIINGTNYLLNFEEELLIQCIDNNNRTDGSLCVQNKSLFLNGYINEFEYSYFAVNLFMCDNKTSNGTCKTQNEIDSFFLDRKFFSSNIHGAEVDVNDNKNPLKKKNKAIFYIIDPKICKRNNYYLKKIKLESDEGWIFKDIQEFYNFKVDYTTMDLNTREENQPLYQFLFFASYNFDEIKRRYQRLPKLLGNFSGIVQFFMIFCFLSTEFFIYIDSMKKIINSLYVFPTLKNITNKQKKNCIKVKLNIKSKNNDKNLNKKQKKIDSELSKNRILENEIIKMKEKIKSNDNINLFLNKDNFIKKSFNDLNSLKVNYLTSKIVYSKTESEINKIPNKYLAQDSFLLDHYSQSEINLDSKKNSKKNTLNFLSKILNSPKLKSKTNYKILKNQIFENLNIKNQPETLKIGYFDYFKTRFNLILNRKLNEKENLIHHAETNYKKELDIVEILKKIHEIEKIKLLIMDDSQLTLFNLLAKPNCCVNDESMITSSTIIMNRIKNYKEEKNKKDIMQCYDIVLAKSKEDEFSKKLIKLVDKDLINLKN